MREGGRERGKETLISGRGGDRKGGIRREGRRKERREGGDEGQSL